MAQGILLVGGLGTRLMPLTTKVPKPMLPIAGLPVTEHQLATAKRAGITSLVLATSYLSEVFVPYFGDGSKWGMHLQYAVEEEPLGTGGAIRNAAQMLDGSESIVIFNGDILTSHDLVEQIRFHESRDADVTLHLTHVEDARAFGCVPVDEDGRVTAFLEKMEKPVANTINAGCYVFHPRVLEEIPLGQVVSIERDIFPELVANGRAVFGFIDDSYWRDIGTPKALLQSSVDLVRGVASQDALKNAGIAHQSADYLAMEGSTVDPTAVVIGGSAIGRSARIDGDALVDGSIVSDGARIMSGAKIRGCFVAAGTVVSSGLALNKAYIAEDQIVTLSPL